MDNKENEKKNERETDKIQKINFDVLLRALKSGSALRQVTRLNPAGGSADKVFPPTYAEGKYAYETRRTDNGMTIRTVLLDSVQSRANRMESALLDAVKNKRIDLPLLYVDFSNEFSDVGTVSTLETPHRIADALFRESSLEGKKFRDTDIGKAFIGSSIRDATGLFQYCPHALTFGQWDSTGPTGMGNKFQRTIVSEIIGINAQGGAQTSSRIDPVLHSNPVLYETADGEWTANPDEAMMENGKPKKYKKKVSEMNLGNIVPTVKEFGGGVTIDYALQTTVISLPAIRKLHFPLGGKENDEINTKARAVVLALGIAGMTHASDQGYDLRSRCLLLSDGDSPIELINANGSTERFYLDSAGADQVLNRAITEAKLAGLPWMDGDIILKPDSKLLELIKKSRSLLSAESDGTSSGPDATEE